MSGYASYNVIIDRENSVFDFQMSYFVEPYNDPETGEYFGDTSWVISYAEVGQPGGSLGGYGSESDTFSVGIGLHFGENVVNGHLTFSAMNTFSGGSISYEWNILEAAYATGDKSIDGAAGIDIILSGSGNDTLRGFGGADILDGGDGNDHLEGGAGGDMLDGGAGDDVMDGGQGDDVYIVQAAGDLIAEAANGGLDAVWTYVSYTLPQGVERMVLIGVGELDLTGNDLGNLLEGNGYANVISGRGGDDILMGYAGADTLYGGIGNDLLDGGADADAMQGGAGDDVYVVDNSGDKVIESAGMGTETVRVLGLGVYTLVGNVENLVFTGANDFVGVGNILGNVIVGDAGDDALKGLGGDDVLVGATGDDILVGGAGADILQGDEGFDRASYADAQQGVALSLLTGGTKGEAAGDSFIDVEAVLGSKFNDVIAGDFGANLLMGGAGADRLVGGGGRDWLNGGVGADMLIGDGDDGVSYAGATGAVTVNLQAQSARGGEATGDRLQGIADAAGGLGDDTLIGGNGDNWLFGDAGSDQILGGGGNDTIEGGAGGDRLAGGGGYDLLSFASSGSGVTVDLQSGAAAGGDAADDSFSGFEGLIGSAFADGLNGDGRANQIFGGAGEDVIVAGAGADTVDGGLGNDTMDGGAGPDTLAYASAGGWVTVYLSSGVAYSADGDYDQFTGFENVRGSDFGDALYGDAGRNAIDGGGGGDYLDGGEGDDVLTGGGSDDIFLFSPAFGRDAIADFAAGNGSEDVIYLGIVGFDTFDEVMAAAVQVGDDTVIMFGPDEQLTLVGVSVGSLTDSDFVLF